ncbi:hypothetical protein GMORB2_5252 [Geosmithia morbida]|uniref:Uncharacterized protein n=1 Tax=Geosmithia morbida TaxID=1094350 RepID=A0A9P4YZG6_9HYPO|nr:uncharacterized protein GMORB2_5252 [Geosmithia morbida]KAF4124586.1 hypothetical protein GMORB2_5252 [Geosmithia morbida]
MQPVPSSSHAGQDPSLSEETRTTITIHFTDTTSTQNQLSNMPSDQDKQNKPEGEKEFGIQPIKDAADKDPKFAPFGAHPGPQLASMPGQEGTKEERQARKEALNK